MFNISPPFERIGHRMPGFVHRGYQGHVLSQQVVHLCNKSR